jgi:hypothetical protein
MLFAESEKAKHVRSLILERRRYVEKLFERFAIVREKKNFDSFGQLR